MILYPAIDLKNGQCVRLIKGDMNQATVFNTEPSYQAQQFESAGAEWLHLVDLDGAFKGTSVNAAAVNAILSAIKLPVQLGGGIRDMNNIEAWLDKGIARVVLGTVALKNPNLVAEACKRFPNQIAVGIDAKGGKVAVEGWAETSALTAFELANRFENMGVAAIIYTDIDRDGLLQGVNVKATVELAASLSIPIIASGGVASITDVKALLAVQQQARQKGGGIIGIISGRAIYDGRLDLQEALKMLREGDAC